MSSPEIRAKTVNRRNLPMCVVVTDDDRLGEEALSFNRPDRCFVVKCGVRNLSGFVASFATTHAVVDERHASPDEVRAITKGIPVDSSGSPDGVLALVKRVASDGLHPS